MWKSLILTAGSDFQKSAFERILCGIPTEKFSESVEVVADVVPSPDSRIGSGGATLNIIKRILEDPNHQDDSKILLVHSGGLSKRMPHLSTRGKVFGYLANEKTILETKLEIYKKDLLEKLIPSGGIMISASDVIEDFKLLVPIENNNADFIVFAHLSTVEVGAQHGVFVMDSSTQKLRKVLQKPSFDEMKAEGAIRNDGMVLTDSCYFMTWHICRKLLESPLLREPVTEEFCCYGDFMRPMGESPKLDYIDESPPTLQKYRRALSDVFRTANVEICELGENSFFHFGSYQEFLEHLPKSSSFHRAFPGLFQSNVVLSQGFVDVPASSFVEHSIGNGTKVGENCIVSCIESENVRIPDNTVVFSIPLEDNTKVTVMIDIHEDIKKKWKEVKWNGHDTGIKDKSMWEAPIFLVGSSVERVLEEWKNGFGGDEVSGLEDP